MKFAKWLGLIAAVACPLISGFGQEPPAPDAGAPNGLDQTQNPAGAADVAPSVSEVVKLAESGASDDVILAYIQNSVYTFNLTADGVIYLKDLGLSSAVVTAMLNHDKSVPSPTPNAIPMPAAPQEPVPPQPAEEPPVQVYDTPPPQVNYFYNDLAPYGSWIQLEGYGWCWQPSTVVVNRGWQPYCDAGHWVYTDAGWLWQSDYSWGWAPFHYGRWYRHERCGWVWTPDTVWGPAWVTWRVSGDHCGWAPLPPHADFDARLGFRFNGVAVSANFDFGLRPDHFTFIALRDFNNRDFGHHRLSSGEANNVFRQTTVINNYTVNNKIIVNRGIDVGRVSAVTHTQFKKVAIRDLPANTPRSRITAGNRGESVVYRPQLKAPERSENRPVQRVDDSHPVVQHTEVRALTVERKSMTGTRISTPVNNPRGPGMQTPARPNPEIQRPAAIPEPSRTTTPRVEESRPQNRIQENRPDAAPRPVVPHETIQTPRATPPAPQMQTPHEVTPIIPKPTTPHVEESHPQPQAPVITRPNVETHVAPQPPAVRSPVVAPPQPQQNSHVYYPKSYHQAESIRSLPPTSHVTPAPAPPAPAPAPAQQPGNDGSSQQRRRDGR